jgi:hypothetical protein
VRLMVCLTLALAAASSSAVEVYRSVAPDGTVVYSDRPSGRDDVPVVIAGRAVTPAAPRSAASRPAPSAGAGDEAASEQAREPTPAELAEERARNCATARDRVERYSASHRLYRALPNGEREYLNDAEIDEARAQAAADVENWCS